MLPPRRFPCQCFGKMLVINYEMGNARYCTTLVSTIEAEIGTIRELTDGTNSSALSCGREDMKPTLTRAWVRHFAEDGEITT